MIVHVLYFASLRDASSLERESLSHEGSLRDLFENLRERYGWRWTPAQLRVAVNGELTGWDRSLQEGDEIAFLPPVSGG